MYIDRYLLFHNSSMMRNTLFFISYVVFFINVNIIDSFSAQETLKFATSLPLLGINESLGRSIQIGIEAAFSEINQNGGINKKLLELIVENDDFEYANTKKNIRNFISKKEILAILNIPGSINNQEILPIINEKKILLYTPFTGTYEVSKIFSRYIINYRPPYINELIEIINMLEKSNIKLSDVVVFEEFNKNLEIERKKVATKIATISKNISLDDLEKVEFFTYIRNTQFMDMSYKSIVKNKKKDVKAFVLIGSSFQLATFIKNMKQFYPNAYYFILSSVSIEDILSELCAKNNVLCSQYTRFVITTQVVPNFSSSNIKIGVEYKNAVTQYLKILSSQNKLLYSEYKNIGYNNISFESYITTRILIEGLKKLDKQNVKITRESIIDALESLGNFDIGLGETKLSISPNNHQISTEVWKTMLNGRNVISLESGLLEMSRDFKNSWREYLP